MLNVSPSKHLELNSSDDVSSGAGEVSFHGILRFLRRQMMTIAAVTGFAILAGLVYCVLAKPQYTATARVLVDNSSIKALRDQAATSDTPASVAIDSQVEIIKSERVLQRAVRQLNLANDADLQISPGLLTRLRGLLMAVISSDEKSSAKLPEDELLADWLRDRLYVRRVGFTNVIEISVTSPSPEKAARIANAIAEGYLADLLEAKYEMGRRAGKWLEDRLKQLSEQTSESDRAVQKFKSENNIVSTGRGLISEQQIGEISTQIILARSQVAEAKARWDRVEEILKGDPSDATVTESLRNDVIVRLRQQYLEAARREADLSARYGQGHMAVATLRTEKRQLLDNIKDELRRIAQSYKSDYEIARLRETTLKSSLDALVAESRTTNQAQVKLRDMEGAVQASREVQESFLKKNMEIAQQESFPVTEARIISPAKAPRYRSSPATMKITAGSAALGLVLGLIFALGFEGMDRTFRTPEQVESALGCRVLGVLPKIDNARLPYRTLHAASLALAGRNTRHSLGDDLGSLRYAMDNPLSQFAETLRHVKFEAGASLGGGLQEGKVLGICSTRPGEGKSLVSGNLAQLVADTRQRAVLIDCDLRYPALTYTLSPEAETGLVEVVTGRVALDDALWTDPRTKMAFLPAPRNDQIHHPNEIFASERMRGLIEQLRKRFDYVILDLPPIIPFTDVRAVTRVVDAFVFVIEWGVTRSEAVQAALRAAPGVEDKLLGCLINKADVTKLSRYYRHEESDYYVRFRSHLDARRKA